MNKKFVYQDGNNKKVIRLRIVFTVHVDRVGYLLKYFYNKSNIVNYPRYSISSTLSLTAAGSSSCWAYTVPVCAVLSYWWRMETPSETCRAFHKNNFFLWRCDPTRVMASSFLRFLDHTQRRTTVGRTPLDEWSARRRDLYLTAHKIHNRQTSIPPLEFEPTISAGERPQT
jgi:hypothetical protein